MFTEHVNHIFFKYGMYKLDCLSEIERSKGAQTSYSQDQFMHYLLKCSALIMRDFDALNESEYTRADGKIESYPGYFRKAEAVAVRYGELPEHPVMVEGGFYSTKHDNIVSSNILLLDIDGFSTDVYQYDIPKILNKWLGSKQRYFVWTTPSSRQYEPRARVAIPLSRNVSTKEYAELRYRLPKLPEEITDLDPASFKLGQFFILPCIINDNGGILSKEEIDEGMSTFFYEDHPGNLLDVDSLPPIPEIQKFEINFDKMSIGLAQAESALEKLVEDLNDIPSGEFWNSFKPKVARLFNRYDIPKSMFEEYADKIEDESRSSKYISFVNWLFSK